MKKQITLLTIAVMFLLAVPLILAEEEIATKEDIQEAGMTPDNPLYPLDLLFERIIEMFDEDSKLIHAQERLAEVKVMIQNNKIEHAEKARIEFTKLRLRIKDKSQISEHTKLMDSLGNKISLIASVKGKLTEIQKIEIKEIIIQHKKNITHESEDILIGVFPYFGKDCIKVAPKYLQKCCHVWAIENNIQIPKCEGEWVIGDESSLGVSGNCVWKCGNSGGTSTTSG